MIEIPLTQGKVALIDAEDWDKVKGYKWYAMKCKNTYYAQACVVGSKPRKLVLLHRVLLPDSVVVDHIDHDGLNNRRCNIRSVTQQQNCLNSRIRPSNTSGYLGVSWFAPRGKWRARLMVSGSEINLGYFKTAFEAALVYDRALTEWAGANNTYNFKGVEV